MDKEKVISDIAKIINENIDESIGCCYESTDSMTAYCNVGSMYDTKKLDTVGIRVFNDYLNGVSIDNLAIKLDVNPVDLNNLFIQNAFPSMGLITAISLVLNLDLSTLLKIYSMFGYKTNKEDFKVYKYFFENDIRDVSLLNEILVSHGLMYLYSKRKLR